MPRAFCSDEPAQPTDNAVKTAETCAVLVVEDEPDIAETLVEMLDDEGISAKSVANGFEAFNALEAGCHPRLIILDLRMPVMTGWEFLAKLRASRCYCGLPVIVLSGELDKRARDLSQAAFVKPPEVDDLLHAIDSLLV